MLFGTDCVRVSAAFFTPSHASKCSLSHQVASIPAMIARMLDGSARTRLCSWNASSRKSNSSGPVTVRISRRSAARDALPRATSRATIAGSASTGTPVSLGGRVSGPGPGGVRTKSARSRTVCSASLVSGSPLPIRSTKVTCRQVLASSRPVLS